MLRIHTCPEWNGWIYYYNEEIRKLSYDEYDYEIDITVGPPFLVGDHLQCIINKDWVTFEVFDGLVNAFDFLFPNTHVREDAAILRQQYWGNTAVN